MRAGYFALPEVAPEKFLAKRWAKTFRIPYLKIATDESVEFAPTLRSETGFTDPRVRTLWGLIFER